MATTLKNMTLPLLQQLSVAPQLSVGSCWDFLDWLELEEVTTAAVSHECSGTVLSTVSISHPPALAFCLPPLVQRPWVEIAAEHTKAQKLLLAL